MFSCEHIILIKIGRFSLPLTFFALFVCLLVSLAFDRMKMVRDFIIEFYSSHVYDINKNNYFIISTMQIIILQLIILTKRKYTQTQAAHAILYV